MQQDAHEMFNFLINDIADTLVNQKKNIKKELESHGVTIVPKLAKPTTVPPKKTWIHELFEGQLTNETICRNCESVSLAIIPGYPSRRAFSRPVDRY
jgi:ubiquitin C-terminal hydrolase